MTKVMKINYKKLNILAKKANLIEINLTLKPIDMKQVFFLILLLPLISIAQNCSDNITEEKDEFTKKVYFKLKDPVVLDKSIFWGYVDKRSLNIKIISTEIISVDENSKIVILFEDESKMQIKNSSSYNLDGKFLFYIGGLMGLPTTYLKRLTTLKIKGIRLIGFKDVQDIMLEPEQSLSVQRSIICLQDKMKK